MGLLTKQEEDTISSAHLVETVCSTRPQSQTLVEEGSIPDGRGCKQRHPAMPAMRRSAGHNQQTPEANQIFLGDKFIQLGQWRMGDADGKHFSIAYRDKSKHFTSVIFRKDGTVHNGPRTGCGLDQLSTWNRALEPNGVEFGDNFVQIGEWRLGTPDGRHFSIAHQDGYTAMIFREDGTAHEGPRDLCGLWQLNTFSQSLNSNIKFAEKTLQIGEWRVGDKDGTHFSFSHQDGYTAMIYRSDGTVHPGPRDCCGLWQLNTYEGRPVLGLLPFETPESNHILVGDKFIQLGQWRMGDADGRHFSIAYKDDSNHSTAVIFQEDGTVLNGPRTCCELDHLSTWNRALEPNGVVFGDNFVQIGEWRLGTPDGRHFSIAHKNGYTAIILRKDGTVHEGPRCGLCCGLWQHNTFSQSLISNIKFAEKTLQIGEWRVGDKDGTHFSFSHQDGYTAMIYRSDGTVHPGPKTCCGLWQMNTFEGRPIKGMIQ